MLQNAYQTVYDLISTAIFGGVPTNATYGVFFCEAFATVSCALLLALPFIVVWRIIRRFI